MVYYSTEQKGVHTCTVAQAAKSFSIQQARFQSIERAVMVAQFIKARRSLVLQSQRAAASLTRPCWRRGCTVQIKASGTTVLPIRYPHTGRKRMEQTTQEQTTASTIGAVVDALIRTDKAGGAMFVALCYDLRKQNHAHYTAERIEALARLYGLL